MPSRKQLWTDLIGATTAELLIRLACLGLISGFVCVQAIQHSTISSQAEMDAAAMRRVQQATQCQQE